MSKREMTIGVTVNLQNYESLRVEVEDDVESEEDVRNLVTFLDQSLALFGRDDPNTKKAVEHYRKRVLQGAAIVPETEAPAPAAPRAAPGPTAAPSPAAPETPGPAAIERPGEAPQPAAKSPAKAAAKAPGKAPAPSPTGALCELCGAPVSAAEEKTSRLFVSKTLCKKCIQTL